MSTARFNKSSKNSHSYGSNSNYGTGFTAQTSASSGNSYSVTSQQLLRSAKTDEIDAMMGFERCIRHNLVAE